MNFEFSDELPQGAGVGRLAVCVLAEEIGRAVSHVPVLSAVYLAAEATMLFGPKPQKQLWLANPARGNDEIMKNMITERALSLPQDPRADRGLPFGDIPTGARQ